MTDHASYILANFSALKSLPVEKLLLIGSNQGEVEYPIPSFDENLLVKLCEDTRDELEKEDNILEIYGDAIIVGDIHGNFQDLLRILNYAESFESDKIIFLGDYVDRGEFSLECIILLFALKVKFPDRYFLLRGNHEFDKMCSQYGFKKEILNYHNPRKINKIEKDRTTIPTPHSINFDKKEKTISAEKLCDRYFANHINFNCYKYTERLYDAFIDTFSYLPIASIVNQTSLCFHGGLSPHLDKIDKIRKQIQRPINDYSENELLCDILWGDPSTFQSQLFEYNPRGLGKIFNGVSVVTFLKNNNLQRIIRGHQCVNNGVQKDFNDKCVTVFSSSSYDFDMGNKSGVLRIFQEDDRIEAVRFKPIHHLNKCDAIYYRVQALPEDSNKKQSDKIRKIKAVNSFGGLPVPLYLMHSKSGMGINDQSEEGRSLRNNRENTTNQLIKKRNRSNSIGLRYGKPIIVSPASGGTGRKCCNSSLLAPIPASSINDLNEGFNISKAHVINNHDY